MKWITVFLVMLLVAATASARVNYTVTDLGTLGGSSSSGNGVSNNGTAVGWAYTSNFLDHSFVYRGSSMEGLPTLGGMFGHATGISRDGHYVSGYAQVPSTATHVFIYTATSGIVDLGTLPGGDISRASGVNDAGIAVGMSTDGIGQRAVMFSNSQVTSLGGGQGYALAITNDAVNPRVVGSADFGGTNQKAFVWQGGVMTNLGTLPGGDRSEATGISGSSIVGWSYSQSVNGPLAFLHSGGTMQSLGTLGGTNSFAADVNEMNEIVGWAMTAQAMHAFIHKNGSMTDLNDLIDPASGWTLQSANAINDHGVIVGFGTNSLGQSHAFLLNPIPTPSASVTLSLLGILQLRRKR